MSAELDNLIKFVGDWKEMECPRCGGKGVYDYFIYSFSGETSEPVTSECRICSSTGIIKNSNILQKKLLAKIAHIRECEEFNSRMNENSSSWCVRRYVGFTQIEDIIEDILYTSKKIQEMERELSILKESL